MRTPRRSPEEESVDLYPGLVVDDGRQGGSITVGPSRLPVSALVGTAIHGTWDEVEADWSPSRYAWTAETKADFLYNLLSVRGEFSRLLLALADAERVQQERVNAAFEGRGPVVIIDPAAPDAQLPPPWWDDADRSLVVVEQLRRCLLERASASPVAPQGWTASLRRRLQVAFSQIQATVTRRNRCGFRTGRRRG